MVDETRKEPTYELITEAFDWIQTFWHNQFEVDDDIWGLLDDDYTVVVPDTMDRRRRRRVKSERMTTNEATRVVERIASLYAHPASIGVQWAGPGTRSATLSDKIERGINEAIDSLNPPEDAPINDDRWNQVALGRCARLILPGSQYWYDFPEEIESESLEEWDSRFENWSRSGPIPVTWKSLAPETTFPTSFGRLGEEHLTWMSMPAFELSDLFSAEEIGHAVPEMQDSYYNRGSVTLGIYANREWLSYVILDTAATEASNARASQLRTPGAGGMLRSVEHKMGRPPIRILPGATGRRKEPGRYWRSVLHPVRELIKAADRRLSEAATASKFDVNPLMKAWMQDDPTGEGSQQEDMSWIEGDVISLRPGQADGLEKEDVQPVYQPQFGDKTQALVQWSLARIERMTGAVEALEGTFGPPGQPAWSRQHAVDQAVRQLSRLTQAVVGSDLDAAETIIAALAVHGQKVHIAQRRKGAGAEVVLNPADLKGVVPVLKAAYKIESSSDKRADYDLGVSLQERVVRGGLAGPSPTRILEEFCSIEQPLEEFKETMTWGFLLSPEIQGFMRNQLVKNAEADITQDEGMDIEELMKLVEEGRLPGPLAEQLIAAASGGQVGGGGTSMDNPFGTTADNNGNTPVGPTPTTVGAVRQGFPFQSTAGGPSPENQA